MNIFPKLNWKIFWTTLLAMFLIVILQRFEIYPAKLIRPIPKQINAWDTINSKLQQKSNTFKPQQKSSSLLIPQVHADVSIQNITAYGVIDLDTGEVLAEKDFSKRHYIASLTKLMTAVVALDLASPIEVFTVNKQAESIIPTKIVLEEGEKLTLEELLHAILLTSANDAAEVIKNGINTKYDEPVFIKAMNEKAKFLHLNNTSFSNPQGFDSTKNFSSIEDLAILSAYALQNYPLIAQIAKKDYEYISETNSHKYYDLYNWNGLVGVYPNTLGLKIGNTSHAGHTTSVAAEREGKKVLVILLGAPGVLERDLIAAQLLDLGFEISKNLPPIHIKEEQLRNKYSTWKYER